jgi:hypothetical protein
MRETAINILVQLLNDNQGNKLTTSLSIGIASLLNQELLRHETANSAAVQESAREQMVE